jgi:putative nucleotidyltransferase with HDIG domain
VVYARASAMSVPPKIPPPLAARRLVAAADLAGDANGVATPAEVRSIRKRAEARPTRGVAVDPVVPPEVQRALAQALGETPGAPALSTLDPALRRLPPVLRRLALEIDGVWGNADGKVSVQELDRVMRYYLAALPFFTKEARAILQLARHLGYYRSPELGASVVELRAALDRIPAEERRRGQQFRALFDEALREADVPGVPELLRDAQLHSPKWHSLSVLEHTAAAVAAIADLAPALGGRDWKDAAACMLLHDVGKILSRRVGHEGSGGVYEFSDHEAIGAKWLQARGLDPELVFQIDHHTVLRSLDQDAMIALCGTPDRLARAIVVYVADQVAKGVTPAQLASFDAQADKIRGLCAHAGIDADQLFELRRRSIERWFGERPPLPSGAGVPEPDPT